MIERQKIKWNLLVAFFLISISYFDIKYHFAPLKYLGLLIIDVVALKDVLISRQMEKQKVAVFVAITYFFVIPTMLSGNINSAINAAIYGIQLSIIILYARNILCDTISYLSIALGGIISMIFAFALDIDKVASQLSYSFGRVRVCGAFMHPNTFGAVALSVYACLFVYLFIAKNELHFISKLMCYFGIAGCVYAAILSDSNNAIIGMLLLFLLVFVYKINEMFSIPGFISKIIITILIIVFGFKLVNSFDEELMSSLNTRINSFDAVSNMPILKLLVGYGIAGGGAIGLGWGAEFSLTQLIYKTGILGCAFYILMFVTFYYKSRFMYGDHKKYVEILIIVFLVCSIAEPYITNITNILPMYFLIMISALSNDISNNIVVEEENQL